MPIRDLFQKLGARAWSRARAALLPPCLVAAYFLGLGLTWFFAAVLRKGPFEPDPGIGTFWRPVDEQDRDEDDFHMQS